MNVCASKDCYSPNIRYNYYRRLVAHTILKHLCHAARIMGVEHVGLGTDFDGDGGVPGLADASEIINFTCHLLKRRFSEQDIRLIMGGNFLRVMEQCNCNKEMTL